MSENLNPLDVLSLLYSEDSQRNDFTNEEVIDTRFENTFDVLKRGALRSFETRTIGHADEIMGIVLRSDDPEYDKNSDPIVRDSKVVLGMSSTPDLRGARVKVLITPHTDAIPNPATYDATFDDYSLISQYPLFTYDANQIPLLAGSFITGKFASGRLDRGSIKSVIDQEPFVLPARTEVVPTANKNFDSYEDTYTFGYPLDYNTDYDRSPDLPKKSQHAPFLAALQPEFRILIKEWLYQVWQQKKITVTMTSGYRTPKEQDDLLKKYHREIKIYNQEIIGLSAEEIEKKYKPIEPAEFSYHNLGMALDFAITLKNGKWLNKKTSKQPWLDSGIVQIAEGIGLRWGGWFSKNYDPIHLDFANFVPLGARRQFKQEALKSKVEPNRFTLQQFAAASTPSGNNVG